MKQTLAPFRITFTVNGNPRNWIRFYENYRTANKDARQVVLRENPNAKDIKIKLYEEFEK